MGVDIHAYVECDFQDAHEPFSSPDSIRCINTGEFFIWRDCDLFHTLGLDNYYESKLPSSPIRLGKIPRVLSQTIVEREALIVSSRINKRETGDQFAKFPLSVIKTWQEEQLQCFEIENYRDYGIELLPGETLLFNPGCELPNFVNLQELKNAFEVCQPKGEKIEYFTAIVSLMKQMADTLSPQHVRMVYWFDTVATIFLKEYHGKFNIDDRWGSVLS